MKTKGNSILQKVAAVLAFVIGAMAVFAGGNVLLGNLPDYYIVDWLPTYNLLMGVVSVFFSAIVIWKNNQFAMPAAIGTFGIHAIVMVILQTAYSGLVAPDSIKAMTVRMVVWVAIMGLLIVQQRNKK